MEKLGIQTTQNVYIEHQIANLGDRLLAQLIDLFINVCYLTLIIFFSSILKLQDYAIIMLLLIPMFFYSFLSEWFFNGQTVGKKILKIKVVKLDGSAPSILSYFLRWILRIVDIWFFYGSIAIITFFVNGKGQRVGDIAAGTTIVKTNRKISLKDSIYQELPDNYDINFTEVNLLSEADINTISEVIKHYKRNKTNQSKDLLEKTKNNVEEKMLVKSKMSSIDFLNVILKDYNYINKHI